MGTAFFVVQANAIAGEDAELNRWYEEQHLGDCLACNTAISAQRYRKAPASGPGDHTYLTLYEVGDPKGFAEDRRGKEGTPLLPRSPALALPAHAFFYRPAPLQPALLARTKRSYFYVEFLNAGSPDGSLEAAVERQRQLAQIPGLGPSELLLVDTYQEREGWRADGIIFVEVAEEFEDLADTLAAANSTAPLLVKAAGLYYPISPRRTRS